MLLLRPLIVSLPRSPHIAHNSTQSSLRLSYYTSPKANLFRNMSYKTPAGTTPLGPLTMSIAHDHEEVIATSIFH